MAVFLNGSTGSSSCLLLFVSYFLVVSGLALGSGNISCIESERQALLNFKNGLIDYGNLLTSWKSSDKDCCRWNRVGCDNRTGHVVLLDLSKRPDRASTWFTLAGDITSSLLKLPYLSYLDLSNNAFTSIPQFMGSLHNLTYLNLSSNRISDVFPYHLGNLSMLQYLDLSDNDDLTADSLDWLDSLSSLRFLKLSYVDFSKALNWLQSIKMHPSLSNLVLIECQFPEVSPSSLSLVDSSESLSILRLLWNTFSSPVHSWLFNLSSALVDVQVQDDQLKGSIPDSFGVLTSLEYLYLSSNQLEGRIPASFRNLCHLKVLYLDHNNISGTFDENLQNLMCANMSLEILNLSSNQLRGTFSDITEFESLRMLSLDQNSLDGYFPESFQHLSKLLVLNVDKNQLFGSLPDLGNFPSLIELHAANNKLNGSFSESIGKLSNLSVLDLSFNSLNGNVTETCLSSLSKLEKLDFTDNNLVLNVTSDWIPSFNLDTVRLRSCKLGPNFPSWLRTQKKITHLDISSSDISDTIPSWFWPLVSTIQYLNLSFNHIDGQLPNLPLKFSIFPAIDLSSNLFDGPIPKFLSNTRALNLSKNKFSGSLSFICAAGDRLSFLDLSDNLLSGNVTDCWVQLRGLIILNIENNKFSGTIPSSMGSLLSIQTLRLSRNNFTGGLPSSLKNCTELKLLDLGENSLSEKLPAWIGESLTKLVVLRLTSNKFSGNISSTICHLNSLQILDFSFNYLSGTIPTCLNNLTALVSSEALGKTISYELFKKKKKNISYEYYSSSRPVGVDEFSVSSAYYSDYASIIWKGVEQEYGETLGLLKIIDLSSNSLTGNIPGEITKLFGLISLNVSRNNLVGTIPEDIGQLKALEVLDLSHNQLSGKIPPSLADMTLLSNLDLSHNKLTGRIPTSTQLQSFGSSSYLRNLGLCGCPLSVKCSSGDSNECSGDRMEQDHPTTGSSEYSIQRDEDLIDRPSLYAGLGVGFAAGFSGFCSLLIASSSWRRAYFKFLSKIWDRINLIIALKMARRGFNAA